MLLGIAFDEPVQAFNRSHVGPPGESYFVFRQKHKKREALGVSLPGGMRVSCAGHVWSGGLCRGLFGPVMEAVRPLWAAEAEKGLHKEVWLLHMVRAVSRAPKP